MGERMKAATLKVYTSQWNVFEPYMVSSPSQVDTYWSILLPPFGNYKLEPEIQQNSHYVYSGATRDISISAQTPNHTTDKLDKNTTAFKMIDSLRRQSDDRPFEDRSQILPGFDSFWRKNSRNKVLKWRDEVPFMNITVTILLCLMNRDTDSRQNLIGLGTREERRGRKYLVYVNWVVLRHQGLALFSVSNDLTELKDSTKHKKAQLIMYSTTEWELTAWDIKHKSIQNGLHKGCEIGI